jgi:hypothetical protein
LRDQLATAKDGVLLGGPTVQEVDVKRKFETIIITESTKSFLQTEERDLHRVGITTERFREAYNARNKFYRTCAADARIRALGFEEAEEFPIRRRDFARLQVAIPPKEEKTIPQPWIVEVITLKVTSPNWDREDRQRQWKARDPKGRERYFRIDDQHFWEVVKAKNLDLHIIDHMKVQWAYIGTQRRNARVLRVLEFNEQALGEPLDENALRAILGLFDETCPDQDDLFRR